MLCPATDPSQEADGTSWADAYRPVVPGSCDPHRWQEGPDDRSAPIPRRGRSIPTGGLAPGIVLVAFSVPYFVGYLVGAGIGAAVARLSGRHSDSGPSPLQERHRPHGAVQVSKRRADTSSPSAPLGWPGPRSVGRRDRAGRPGRPVGLRAVRRVGTGAGGRLVSLAWCSSAPQIVSLTGAAQRGGHPSSWAVRNDWRHPGAGSEPEGEALR